MALTYTALGLGGCRRRVTVPGGATAPIRAHWPRHRLYLAGDVNVWLALLCNSPLRCKHVSRADEQSPTGRLTWRCVYYGGDCRTDLFTMHSLHRLARFCCISPKAGTCGQRRHALSLCAGHGPAADANYRLCNCLLPKSGRGWNKSNRVYFYDPCTSFRWSEDW